MKKKILFNLTTFIVLQAIIIWDICSAYGAYSLAQRNNANLLSPVLKINNSQLQQLFLTMYPVEKEGKVEKVAVIGPIKREDGRFYSDIEINFKYDRPGFLADVLEIVNKYKGNVISQEYIKGVDKLVFKFIVITKEETSAREIIGELGTIADVKKPKYEKIFKLPSRKRVLEIDILDRPGSLLQIANFLKEKKINITSFLTPEVTGRKAHFIFEVEIPISEEILGVVKELQEKFRLQDEVFKIEVSRKGELIDKMLDDYLLKHIGEKIDISKKERKELRKALHIVAARHLSQARKDRQTPFLMHQFEVVKILVNEIKALSPEIIKYVAEALQISESKVKILILSSALLHDAIEEGDISKADLMKKFGFNVYEIVLLLSKETAQKGRKAEAVYLKNILKKQNILGLIAQLIKIADRIHNLRTLEGLKRAKQKITFFSTLDTFYYEFINKINLKFIQKDMGFFFLRAIELLDKQILKIGMELKFLNEKGEIIDSQLRSYLICNLPRQAVTERTNIKRNFRAYRYPYQLIVDSLHEPIDISQVLGQEADLQVFPSSLLPIEQAI